MWVSNPRAVAKNNPLYLGSKSNFTDEECYIISAVSQKRLLYRGLSFTNKLGSGMECKLFYG